MDARLRGTRGNVSLLVVIMLPALLVAAGLVLDGGRQLQVRRDTSAAAAAAARAGTQLSEQEIHGAGLDGGLAAQRASVELANQGMTGSVVGRRAVGHRDGHGDRRPPHPARLALRVVDVDGHASRGSVTVNGRRRHAGRWPRLVATILLVVGVPVVLIVFVGNPWPGRTTLELGDEVALVVGVLAVLAWLVWLRFAAAVVVEVRAQVAELRGPPRPARFSLAAAGAPRRRSARPAARRRRPDRAADRATRHDRGRARAGRRTARPGHARLDADLAIGTGGVRHADRRPRHGGRRRHVVRPRQDPSR